MKKWIYFLISCSLLLLPQLVLAQTDDTTAWFHFGPPAGDLSVKYLCSAFGSIGGLSCPGAPESVFSGIFRVLNIGMLAIAGLVLIFTTVKTVAHAATEGTPMGQGSSYGSFIRIILGNVLLVPGKLGYSAINAMVIWMVLQGIGFADMAWNGVLDYLSKGGVIHVTQSGDPAAQRDKMQQALNKIDPNFVYRSSDNDGDNATIANVFRSLLCMHSLQQGLNLYFDNLKDPLNKETTDAQKTLIRSTAVNLTYYVDPVNQTLQIPGWQNYKVDASYERLVGPNGLNWYNFPFAATLLPGVCGTYSWNTTITIDPAKYPNITEQEYKIAKTNAINNMLSDLDQTASSLADEIFTGIPEIYQIGDKHTITNSDSLKSRVKDALVNASASYMAEVNTVRMKFFQVSSAPTDSPLLKHLKTMREEGWVSAGRYFWDIVRQRNINSAQEGVTNYPAFSDSNGGGYGFVMGQPSVDFKDPEGGGPLIRHWKNDIKTGLNNAFSTSGFSPTRDSNSKVIAYVETMLNFVNTAGVSSLDTISELNNQTVANQGVGLATIPYLDEGRLRDISLGLGISGTAMTVTGVLAAAGIPMATAGWSHIVPWLFAKAVNKVLRQWNESMNNTEISPIEKLVQVGDSMIDAATDFWDDLFKMFVAMSSIYGGVITAESVLGIGLSPGGFWGATLGAIGSVQNIGNLVMQTWGIIQTAFTIFIPATIGITVPMFVTGLTLAVYVPLIPFMLFTFGVISWLIFVLESLAASPLIALGVTHPEGQNMLGRSEQGLMLLVSVFLRPIMMVVGLVAGIVLSYVAIEILNHGFSGIIGDLGISSGGQIKLIMVIVLYTFFVMSLVHQCFTLIYQIPDEIMKYIGAQAHKAAEAEKFMGEVKGGFEKYGEAMGGAMAKTPEAALKAGGEFGKGAEAEFKARSKPAGQKILADRKKTTTG